MHFYALNVADKYLTAWEIPEDISRNGRKKWLFMSYSKDTVRLEETLGETQPIYFMN